MDLAFADLKHVDMAGECGRAIYRHVEIGNGAQGGNIIGGEEDGNLDRDRGAIGEQHESLDFIVAALVDRDGLQNQIRYSASVIVLGRDGDAVQVERHPALRSPVLGRSEEHTSELQSLMRISYAA